MNIVLTILIFYLSFTLSTILLKIVFTNKRTVSSFILSLFSVGIAVIYYLLEFPFGNFILLGVIIVSMLIFVIVNAGDIARSLDEFVFSNTRKVILMGSEKTMNAIIEASLILASEKVGAIITIEKGTNLDIFVDKAIQIDAIVTSELLENIFIKNSPLHDGGVIIKGDRIACAGAYYPLSSNDSVLSATMGSRHRAGLGISEKTDSATIVVSEENGTISICFAGVMFGIKSKDQFVEYLTGYMK